MQYPLIKAIFDYQRCGGEGDETLRFLHAAQLQALETYWFLRLVKKTPRCMDLYRGYYQGEEIAEALSVTYSSKKSNTIEPGKYLKELLEDKNNVRKKRIDAIFESYHLKYPSYIFALAMGTGKTVLIGAIIAIEFVMSMEYPEGSFMKNALVFAPGKTILESLRELSYIDYENILPPFHCKKFLANLKTHYTSDKKRMINTQFGSRYNLVVTNTEKFILRKTKSSSLQKEKEFEKNLRFHHLSKLPSLGIFSDEAHHTYGNEAGKELKRVRETINRLHEHRNIVCVVNTTGTPYYNNQFLKDVVIWYGLAEGIRDKILKSITNGIRQYDIKKDNYRAVVERIIQDFFETYGDVVLPAGQKAKIAFYFNRQEDLEKVKLVVEKAVVALGETSTCVLTNTQRSSAREVEEFHRLNDARSNKRVVLLVGKGREGWNCPSLFACALITKQTRANNYVLQASTRCLRGVRGNNLAARIYLDSKNALILDKELQMNFGRHMSLELLEEARQEKGEMSVEIVKTELPSLVIDREVHTWKRDEETRKALCFQLPHHEAKRSYFREEVNNVSFDDDFKALVQQDVRLLPIKEKVSVEQAASAIALPLHLDGLEVVKALRKLYDESPVARSHIPVLQEQAEGALGELQPRVKLERKVIALIRTKDNEGKALFEERSGCLFHTFKYSKQDFDTMKEKKLFVARRGARDEEILPSMRDKWNVSFHYTPYNLSNMSEHNAFTEVLRHLNVRLRDINGFYFTGSITDSRKTDMWFEYKGADNRMHRYFPDFVLCKKSGTWLIVEVKSERDKDSPKVKLKEEAVLKLATLQPEKIGYHIIYYPPGDLEDIREWIDREKNNADNEGEQ